MAQRALDDESGLRKLLDLFKRQGRRSEVLAALAALAEGRGRDAVV